MTDALLEFGALTISSTTIAAFAANAIDFGVEKFHPVGKYPAVVVFTATTAVKGFVPTIFSGTSATANTAVATAPAVDLADGEAFEMALPLELSRFVRVGGTGTSGSLTARIEMGGRSH